MALGVTQGQLSGQRRPGLLPAEATSFVGRSAELAEISALLATTRLVTIAGPAGVGKTRTALRAAAAAAGRYPDGIRLAELGEIDDPAKLAESVAMALGLRQADTESLLRYLRGKRLLLILDTCEHMVEACAAFAGTVLRTAPGVSLLATSRQPLDAQGEHAFPLLPLPVGPVPKGSVPKGSVAADLFAQRAAAVVPGFALTPENLGTVTRLCARLDGLPLAIELAAIRLRALPLDQLTSRVESGIRLLTVSRRGTSPRHQTLRAAVEWSHRWCTPAEQALWERLSAFGGSFDVSGAQDVCAGGVLSGAQVLSALVGLVDKSVVLREAPRHGAGPARYRLPAAMREFGADRLAEPRLYAGRLAARSLAMADGFDARFRAATWHRGRTPGDQADALRKIRVEYVNLRTALGYTLGSGEHGCDQAGDLARWRTGADIAVRLSAYWQATCQFDEGRHWLGKVVDLFPEPAGERALALAERGRLATFAGDIAAAVADIRESIRLAPAARHRARGYLYLNLALALAGEYAEAEEAGETARQQLAGGPPLAAIVTLEAQLAFLYQLTGDTSAAIEHCDYGLSLVSAVPDNAGPADAAPSGERWFTGYLHLFSGLALAQRPGREQAALLALHHALTARHELGDALGSACAVEALAWVAVRRRQFEHAAWLLGAADRLWTRAGRRLSGVAVMEDSHQQAVSSARGALGERPYAAAFAHGGRLALDAVVMEAVNRAELAAAQRGRAAEDLPVNSVLAKTALTEREREIARLVASGLSNREIATRLFISKRTVDAHVEHIFAKLEISSRVQLTVVLQDQAPGRHPGD